MTKTTSFSPDPSAYGMTWKHKDNSAWDGPVWFELVRMESPGSLFRRPKVRITRVKCAEYSFGAVPSRMVLVRKAYERVGHLLSGDWTDAERHGSNFQALTRSMDLLLSFFEEREGTAEELEALRYQACVEAGTVYEGFRRIEEEIMAKHEGELPVGSLAQAHLIMDALRAQDDEKLKNFHRGTFAP